ncbi:SRPBCC family protein [Amycolatopsis jejuensis]|uniref:SRPBCC family protein n=1 Tax=Amycolatopsis jejuensis TaxID=330084 RepID=UPI0005270F6A|nr:SRPBCC family protein [Amycolatopsis jejuensis]
MAAPEVPGTTVPRPIDLVTRNVVEIVAEPATIWPFLLDTDSWKQGAKPVRESGEPDSVGEIRVARQVVDGVEYTLTIETVVLEPPTRKVVKLLTGSSGDPGWAAWQLVPLGASTLVSYDVYSRHDAGGTGMTADDYLAAQRNRFDAELAELKRLAEAEVPVR